MAKFCLQCWNEITKAEHTESQYILSCNEDFCESCGQYKRVVISGHSLRNYLERQSTARLDSMLNYYLRQEQVSNYAYAVPLIMDVLWEREKNDLPPITPELVEQFRQCMEGTSRAKDSKEE